MPYSWLNFAQAKTALAGRLSDPSKIFWVDDELDKLLKESLRTWNSIAQFYRDRCTFNTQPGIAFYDLTQTANPSPVTGNGGVGMNSASTMLGYTLEDQDLIKDIEYHLIEPITTNFMNPWTGTEQFDMDSIVRAIERRRNLFLLLTGLNLSHFQVPFVLGDGRLSLSDSIQLIRRVAWLDSDGTYTPLWREDEESANFLHPGWAINNDTPVAYSMFLPPPVAIQLIPSPISSGTLDLVTVTNPANLDEVMGTLLNVPDDWAWVVKWGALADLLGRDGQAFDPARSEYCEKRFQEGVRFALLGGTINNAVLDGMTVAPSDINDFDSMLPTWQNVPVATGSNIIEDIAILGRNLIALSPVPEEDSVGPGPTILANPHSIQLDVVRNMPIPTADTDSLQVGREHFDAILDYAEHLARFKQGMDEVNSTLTQANSFMQQAMLHNKQLMAEAKDYDIMQGYSKKEEVDRRRFRRVEEAA